jgi:Tfp pilus assembly protein PilX
MPRNRDGFALVTSLLVVVVLSLLAVGAVMLSNTEKRTSLAERVHNEAVFSADAGGEMAINFLRLSDSPPQILDFAQNTVRTEIDQPLNGAQQFDYECQYSRKRPRPGWGVEYLDYDYRVVTSGEAAASGRSDLELVASRLFREGY